MVIWVYIPSYAPLHVSAAVLWDYVRWISITLASVTIYMIRVGLGLVEIQYSLRMVTYCS